MFSIQSSYVYIHICKECPNQQVQHPRKKHCWHTLQKKRCLYLMKCSSKSLQNFPFVRNLKTFGNFFWKYFIKHKFLFPKSMHTFIETFSYNKNNTTTTTSVKKWPRKEQSFLKAKKNSRFTSDRALKHL